MWRRRSLDMPTFSGAALGSGWACAAAAPASARAPNHRESIIVVSVRVRGAPRAEDFPTEAPIAAS